MRRLAAPAMFSLVVACAPGLSEHKPLAQQPIGTGVVGGPIATLPTEAAPSSSSDSGTAAAPTTTEPATPASSPSAACSAAGTVAELCPPKGQKPDLSRLAAKSGCKTAVKSRSSHLTDLRSNEQLLASMQANAPEREELVFRLAQGYAALECSLATACAKARDSKTGEGEIPITEAKKKTDDYCATMKSDFPKSKRHCP